MVATVMSKEPEDILTKLTDAVISLNADAARIVAK